MQSLCVSLWRAALTPSLCRVLPQSPEDRDRLQDLELSAAWVTERILPFLVAPAEDVISTQQVKLAQRVVEVIMASNCLFVYLFVCSVCVSVCKATFMFLHNMKVC